MDHASTQPGDDTPREFAEKVDSGLRVRTAIAFGAATLAASAIFFPSASSATVINFPPPGSTAFIAVYEIDSGKSACPNLQCAIVSSANAAVSLPTTTFTSSNGLTSITASGDVSAGAFHSFITSNVGPEIDMAMQDTYTVHGTVAGTFPVTASIHVTGTATAVPNGPVQVFLGGQVILKIGTLDINPAALLPTVDPFAPGPGDTTVAQQSLPVVVNPASPIAIDVLATYTRLVTIGSAFDLAYFMSSDTGKGTIDLSHTATISFTTPDGVFLTSAMGGEFGDVPTTGQAPLPAAWTMMLGGLAGLGAFMRKRRAAKVPQAG